MSLELSLFFLLVAAGLLPVLRVRRGARPWVWTTVLSIAGFAVLSAFLWSGQTRERAAASAVFAKQLPNFGRDDGYVTSETCRSCHPDQYESWHQSYHRTMTQVASAESVLGDFENVTLDVRGDRYVFTRRGDEFWVEMPDPDWRAQKTRQTGIQDWTLMKDTPRVLKRVTMVTGSHRLQKYWVASTGDKLQYDIPFTWMIPERRWVLREDSMVRDPKLPLLVQLWNINCIKCHTTAPAPGMNVQTRQLDSRVGELGISCEACHGPADEHIRWHNDPVSRYGAHFAAKPDAKIFNPAKVDHRRSSDACGQCHGMKVPYDNEWLRGGFKYRPGDDLQTTAGVLLLPARTQQIPWLDQMLKQSSEMLEDFFWPDGAIRISGRELNGMAESPCYERGQMSCVSCHSLHESDPDRQLAQGVRTNEACYQCHESFRSKLVEHTHHPAESSGSECYNCHMPKTSWGLMRPVRSHKVTSPTVRESLANGRPNACNLCHIDKPQSWVAQKMTEFYGQPPVELTEDDRHVSAMLLWLLRGDAGQRGLAAWSFGWKPARTAGGEHWTIPFLAGALTDPYGAVRNVAGRALQSLPGFGDFPYDFVGAEAERAQARATALERWEKLPKEKLDRTGLEVLLLPEGKLDADRIQRYESQRSQRSVFLVE